MTQHPIIYVAGHRGMVVSAIVRQLSANGHPVERIVTRSHAELDLTIQAVVNTLFSTEKPGRHDHGVPARGVRFDRRFRRPFFQYFEDVDLCPEFDTNSRIFAVLTAAA
jgi:nucleoside-diphosphate-sugar epimerase